MSCVVCTESFNKTLRKPVTCPYCPAKICMVCHKRYLLDTTEPAHCMSCRTAWSSEVCFNLLPKSFQHEYSVRRAELCVAQEKNLLPETMVQLQRERLHSDMKRHVRKIGLHSNNLVNRVFALTPGPTSVSTSDLLTAIEENILAYKQLKHDYDGMCIPRFVERSEGVGAGAADTVETEDIVQTMYLPCPYDGCKGFTTRGGTCGLCSKKVCMSCRMPKGDDHTCSADDVASIELMRKDCKPCPKCRAMIHRWVGCPQMFCTVCHAKFNWNTGELLKNIHNPHLTEWMLTHGMQGDTDCGIFVSYDAFPEEARRLVGDYYNQAHHIRRFVIPGLRNDIEPVHEPLRRKYLQSVINEKTWVNLMRLYNRKAERTQEIIQVLEMFQDVVLRGLNSVHAKKATWEDIKVLLCEVTKSMNSKLDAIHVQYNIVVYKYKWVPQESRSLFDFE